MKMARELFDRDYGAMIIPPDWRDTEYLVDALHILCLAFAEVTDPEGHRILVHAHGYLKTQLNWQ